MCAIKNNKTELKIKDVIFGQGRPKICLPVVEKTREAILEKIEAIEPLAHYDVIEIRLDYFEDLKDVQAMMAMLQQAGSITSHLVLATFRTQEEGGEIAISNEDYQRILEAVIEHHVCDLIDIELSKGNQCVSSLITKAHEEGLFVILSSHDFQKTPEDKILKEKLEKMEIMGGDLLKIAVMPQSKQDVIRFLNLTAQCSSHLSKPLITMSMGKQGVLSRISGELYGSTMTFATVGKASAPGQIPLEEMHHLLEVLAND